MRKMLNAFIIIFSVCNIAFVIRGQNSTLFYFTLFFIEWLAIMIINPMTRRVTFRKVHRRKNKELKDEAEVYGNLTYNNVEEIVSGLSEESFSKLLSNVLELRGYNIDKANELPSIVLAKKGEQSFTIITKPIKENEYEVGEDFILGIVDNLYQGKVIVITNGRFTKSAIKQANNANIALVNENKFITLIRQTLYYKELQDSKNLKRKKLAMPNNEW